MATDRILIVGAGPTGSLLALGLAQQGFQVLLIDQQARPDLVERSRAYALTHSSRRLLQRLNLWEQLHQFSSPFDSLRLDDRVLGLTAWFRR
ncbi:2-octaprenyl-6-methoxyphenol 4-monooxygenase, partial [Pseudomonas sp. HMWF031]